MGLWKILTIICAVSVHAESKWSHNYKREISTSICDPVQNTTNRVLCYCGRLSHHPDQIGTAECYQTGKNISQYDSTWDEFKILQNVSKLTLTNTRGIAFNYIPTNALRYTKAILRLDVKYCNIEKIHPYAFANLSVIEEMTLRDNQIKIIAPNAFTHHARVKTISLDQNEITELNRNVFVDLPSLEQLFLTANKITTIHDKAFVYLTNLKELEIDKNSIFTLNSETFSGLRNLEKLELSSNSLEVIGDNTFSPLINLRVLNLDENKIQMLDEKAFNGLARLQVLSLARNKLSTLENVKIFDGLESLTSLSLKDNKITFIKPEVILPILSNFYGKTSLLNIEGNQFGCNCSLDVFRPILNKTQNVRLTTDLQNLQCYPSEEVKQKWEKVLESTKNTGQVFEDIEPQSENTAYEYYDETELNGTIFYFDMRHILNCSNEDKTATVNVPDHAQIPSSTNKIYSHNEEINNFNTKATPSPITIVTPAMKPLPKKYVPVDKAVLDLSTAETTTSLSKTNDKKKQDISNTINIDDKISKQKYVKEHLYTTSRLATVSAKPIENKLYDDHDMASDEAKPELKAHRSNQEDVHASPKHKNDSHKTDWNLPLLVTVVFSFRLFF